MSLFLTLPISRQGVVTDLDTAALLPATMAPPFAITDVFLYSHGWWTTAEAAMVEYNKFSISLGRVILGLGDATGRPKGTSLGIGLHWPSMVSEDARSVL